jgi:hypothetical protein
MNLLTEVCTYVGRNAPVYMIIKVKSIKEDIGYVIKHSYIVATTQEDK